MRDADRDIVIQRLKNLGFDAEPIEETVDERPDLVARKSGTTMYVEVKSRVEDAHLRAAMESVRVGETKQILSSLDKDNSVSKHVKKANGQLAELARRGDFRLLWFRTEQTLFAHNAHLQACATLLGVRTVLVEIAGTMVQRDCLYAGHADFFRYRDIDGAMIEVTGPGMEGAGPAFLVLNEFSPRAGAFTESPIVEAFSDAVFDATRPPQSAPFYVMSGSADRRDDVAVLSALQEKYAGHRFIRFLESHSGTVLTTIDARSAQEPE